MSTHTADLFEQAAAARPGALRLELPWPPSVNAYWRAVSPRNSTRVIVFTTEVAKTYRKNVEALVLQQFRRRPEPLVGELLLDVLLCPPDARRRDADNFNKCLWDAMQGAGLFLDDCQVQSFRVTKGPVVRGGLVKVEIWERGKSLER